jgi:glycosyltransferase involved in cell wall biosynthesis
VTHDLARRRVVDLTRDLPPAGHLPRQDVILLLNEAESLGGAQRFGHTLAQGLAGRGHRVLLLGMEPADGPPHRYEASPRYETRTLLERRETRNVGRERLAADPSLQAQQDAHDAEHARTVAALRDLLAERPAAVLVAVQVWVMTWLTEAVEPGRRVVGMAHESIAAAKASPRWRRMQRHYPSVDALLLLTESDALEAEAAGFDNVAVLPNPAPFVALDPAPLTAPVVVALGRLSAEKRPDRLVEAFAAATAALPDWRLVWFGDGPRRAEVEDLVARLGVADRVSLPGTVTDPRAALAQGSVLALSSDHEGLPMAVVEAMTLGIPCVAVDCAPGIRELVTDGVDGLVTPPGDTAELARGLARLMRDGDLRRELGAAAQVTAQRFHPDRILDVWESLLVHLLR